MSDSNPQNHTESCGPYCAKQHCKCGRDALHGMKICGVCPRKSN